MITYDVVLEMFDFLSHSGNLFQQPSCIYSFKTKEWKLSENAEKILKVWKPETVSYLPINYAINSTVRNTVLVSNNWVGIEFQYLMFIRKT